MHEPKLLQRNCCTDCFIEIWFRCSLHINLFPIQRKIFLERGGVTERDILFFEATWLIPQPSRWLKFLRFQPSKLFKNCVFRFTEWRCPNSFKDKNFQFYMKGVMLLACFTQKKCLLHLELKMLDCGGIATSGSSLWRLIL